MATITKFITAHTAAKTVYDLFRDEDGQVLNNTSLLMVAWVAAARADYAFALTEDSGEMYSADVDDSFPIGTTLFRFTYEQAGASPADGDTLLYGPIPVEWTGESVIVDGETSSITDLCNYAFAKLGGAWEQNKLASYFETTDSAEKCQLLWPKVRKEVLIRGSTIGFNWSEATKYAEAGDAQLSGANIPEMANWEYAFALPDDCLRVIAQISEADLTVKYPFEVMRDMLLSNAFSNDDADTAYIKYIYDNDDVTTYGDALYNAMATKLASELASTIAGDQLRNQLLQEYESLVLQLAAAQNQAETYHVDDGAGDVVERRHNRYGRKR